MSAAAKEETMFANRTKAVTSYNQNTVQEALGNFFSNEEKNKFLAEISEPGAMRKLAESRAGKFAFYLTVNLFFCFQQVNGPKAWQARPKTS